MHVFLIGGPTSGSKDGPAAEQEYPRLSEQAERLGRTLADEGHVILVCSPFPDSIDHHAVVGASTSTNRPALIEFHYLDLPDVRAGIDRVTREHPGAQVSCFRYPPPQNEGDSPAGKEALSIAWLLPQIRAMDRSHVVVALGGRDTGAANMLLQLASARRKAVVPLPFMGGAAAQAFVRQQHELADQWGSDLSWLQDPTRLEDIVKQLQIVLDGAPGRERTTENMRRAPRFFISYPRARPAEADFVEALLRRQSGMDAVIIRDEQEFEAGHEISAQIRDRLFSADVFIALWCREYACSPWCYDELELALERHASGLGIWILLVDDTRIVPRRARDLLHIPARTRDEIEAKLLAQLAKLLSSRA